MNINILRMIGIIIIGIAIVVHGREKNSMGLQTMGLGVILMSIELSVMK